VRPRQQVNQICRALEGEGLIRRYPGPDRKIVNEFAGEAHAPALATGFGGPGHDHAPSVPVMDRATEHTRPPGSSREQQDAERVMLDLLGHRLGRALEPATITIPSGARVHVDGTDPDRTVLVECWAHQGPPKSAQRHKVLADAFKLAWISTTLYPRPRLALCMSDPQAAAPFTPGSKSWASQALHDSGVDIILVDLPDPVRRGVQKAQQRQYR
jgi:hypothetical protein